MKKASIALVAAAVIIIIVLVASNTMNTTGKDEAAPAPVPSSLEGKKDPATGAVSLAFEDVTIYAPNEPDRPYRVFAQRDGKTIWEIDGEEAKSSASAPGSRSSGVAALVIKNVAESDLNARMPDLAAKKELVGQPALYIKDYNASLGSMPGASSWKIVDIYTGDSIGFIGTF